MAESETTFIFVANLLCLDFVNTEPIVRGERLDLLGSLEDLLSWLEAAEVLPPEAARRAKRWTGSAEGEAVFRQAIRLRATLRDAAERLTAGRPVSQETVKTVNRILASRPVYPQLTREGKGFSTHLVPVADALLHLLVPVAESAAWLLEHGELSLVRRCENPECVLVFYDTTKNKKRRWCSMDGCGSRAKAMAYYRRKQESGGRSSGGR
jgi:predicted RNA-binding Zn ribbon-like protein